MPLLLPFEHTLPNGSCILICGMGGGFDVFCGLPLAFALQSSGYHVQLASVSFAELHRYTDAERLSPTLVHPGPAPPGLSGYHPERFLSRWFSETQARDSFLWCIEPTGASTMRDDLRLLRTEFPYETLILIDGGIDSLTRGDEEFAGTVLEDYVTLTAAAMLDEVPIRIHACIGMGIERDVSTGRVLENIAGITSNGGFLGCNALTAGSPEFHRYMDALLYVHQQPGQQPSVINASIVSAVQGHFGDVHLTERTRRSELAISPLMSIYWYFDLPAVARRNLFVEGLRPTKTAGDAFGVIYDGREAMNLKPSLTLSLP